MANYHIATILFIWYNDCMKSMKSYIKTQLVLPEYYDTIVGLLNGLKDYCFEMAFHCVDVANMCLELVKHLDDPEIKKPENIKTLYMGALVHDIGKLTIEPVELLVKKHLTREEKTYIRRTHIEGTLGILLEQGLPKNVINVAYHHHERLDGSGYELGLAGEQISKLDKILQVADCTCSMLMDRSYRLSLGVDATKSELDKMKDNNKLDASIVDIAKQIVSDKFYDVEKSYTNQGIRKVIYNSYLKQSELSNEM